MKYFISDLIKSRELDSSATKLIPSACNIPRIYGLPKAHKENFPVRPVVSMVGTALYDLARFVDTELLQPILPHFKTCAVKDSFEFCHLIQGLTLKEDQVCESFDVKVCTLMYLFLRQ